MQAYFTGNHPVQKCMKNCLVAGTLFHSESWMDGYDEGNRVASFHNRITKTPKNQRHPLQSQVHNLPPVTLYTYG